VIFIEGSAIIRRAEILSQSGKCVEAKCGYKAGLTTNQKLSIGNGGDMEVHRWTPDTAAKAAGTFGGSAWKKFKSLLGLD
jgi:hypothetical protein